MTDHPITPPPELVQQWAHSPSDWNTVVSLIAQWGADQELEACCEWMSNRTVVCPSELRAARRPKPQSLKEQAWKLLECYGTSGVKLTTDQCNTIRRALEALPND